MFIDYKDTIGAIDLTLSNYSRTRLVRTRVSPQFHFFELLLRQGAKVASTDLIRVLISQNSIYTTLQVPIFLRSLLKNVLKYKNVGFFQGWVQVQLYLSTLVLKYNFVSTCTCT